MFVCGFFFKGGGGGGGGGGGDYANMAAITDDFGIFIMSHLLCIFEDI